jgi:hypothetical protein
MEHNMLKKGTRVLLSGGRRGTIMDNRKGIRRCVKIEERDGWYGDMGDVYVDEITWFWTSEEEHEVNPDLPHLREVTVSKAHAKQMGKIRQQLKEMFL